MGMLRKNAAIGAVLAGFLATVVGAQPISTTIDYGMLSFESWCRDREHFPADRCQARRPEDVKAFVDYRAVIERYDTQYQKEREKERNARRYMNRDITQTMGGLR